MSNDELKPPEKRVTDHLYAAGKATTGVLAASLSGLPLLKLPAETLFGILVADPGQRRSRQFFEDVCHHLGLLAAQNRVTMDVLQQHDEFISALRIGMVAATATQHPDKLETLRNAVINVALGPNEPDAEREIILRLVEQLTWLHVKFLSVFSDATGAFRAAGFQPPPREDRLGIINLVIQSYPSWKASQEALDIVLRDLEQRRLIRTDGSKLIRVQPNGSFDKLTTPFADRLLSYISAPSA